MMRGADLKSETFGEEEAKEEAYDREPVPTLHIDSISLMTQVALKSLKSSHTFFSLHSLT